MLAIESENMKTQQKEAESVRENETRQMELQIESGDKRYAVDKNAETQIAVTQLKEGQQINLEAARALLKDAPLEVGQALDVSNELQRAVGEAIDNMKASLDEFRAQAVAPVKIVRENGRIVGKEVNGQFIPLEDAG